jgi:hypothetical protein
MDIEEGVKSPANIAGDVKDVDISQIVDNKPEEGSIIAPDQFDVRYETSRKEIWSYYACV